MSHRSKTGVSPSAKGPVIAGIPINIRSGCARNRHVGVTFAINGGTSNKLVRLCVGNSHYSTVYCRRSSGFVRARTGKLAFVSSNTSICVCNVHTCSQPLASSRAISGRVISRRLIRAVTRLCRNGGIVGPRANRVSLSTIVGHNGTIVGVIHSRSSNGNLSSIGTYGGGGRGFRISRLAVCAT